MRALRLQEGSMAMQHCVMIHAMRRNGDKLYRSKQGRINVSNKAEGEHLAKLLTREMDYDCEPAVQLWGRNGSTTLTYAQVEDLLEAFTGDGKSTGKPHFETAEAAE